MDANQLLQDGTIFAGKAVAHDRAGEYKVAHFFYMEAAEAILKAIANDQNNTLVAAKGKALQYIERAEALQLLLGRFYHVVMLICISLTSLIFKSSNFLFLLFCSC